VYLHIPEEIFTSTNEVAEIKLVMDHIKGCSLDYLLNKKSNLEKIEIVAKIY